MEKEIKTLKKHLFRSKLAIYSILGFLILLTFLLIYISNNISNTEISFNYQPKAADLLPGDLIGPGEGTPATPITCKDYKIVIANMKLELDKLKQECPRCPNPTQLLKPGLTGDQAGDESQPNVIIPSDPCSRYLYLKTYLNGLEEFIARLCVNCPSLTEIPLSPMSEMPTWTEITEIPDKCQPDYYLSGAYRVGGTRTVCNVDCKDGKPSKPFYVSEGWSLEGCKTQAIYICCPMY